MPRRRTYVTLARLSDAPARVHLQRGIAEAFPNAPPST